MPGAGRSRELNSAGRETHKALLAIVVLAFSGVAYAAPITIDFDATTSAGDLISAGAAPPLVAGSYTEVALGELDWLSITSLSFYCDVPDPGGFGCSYDLDNVVVGAAVPIPAAAWLFLSALGLLGSGRRLGSE